MTIIVKVLCRFCSKVTRYFHFLFQSTPHFPNFKDHHHLGIDFTILISFFTLESTWTASCRVLHSSFSVSLHSFMNETLLWITGHSVYAYETKESQEECSKREQKIYVWGNNLLSSRFIFIWINSQLCCFFVPGRKKNVPENSYGASSYLFLHLTSHSPFSRRLMSWGSFHILIAFSAMTFECSSFRDCIDLFPFPIRKKYTQNTFFSLLRLMQFTLNLYVHW